MHKQISFGLVPYISKKQVNLEVNTHPLLQMGNFFVPTSDL